MFQHILNSFPQQLRMLGPVPQLLDAQTPYGPRLCARSAPQQQCKRAAFKFLHLLVASSGAKNVGEVGVLGGQVQSFPRPGVFRLIDKWVGGRSYFVMPTHWAPKLWSFFEVVSCLPSHRPESKWGLRPESKEDLLLRLRRQMHNVLLAVIYLALKLDLLEYLCCAPLYVSSGTFRPPTNTSGAPSARPACPAITRARHHEFGTDGMLRASAREAAIRRTPGVRAGPADRPRHSSQRRRYGGCTQRGRQATSPTCWRTSSWDEDDAESACERGGAGFAGDAEGQAARDGLYSARSRRSWTYPRGRRCCTAAYVRHTVRDESSHPYEGDERVLSRHRSKIRVATRLLGRMSRSLKRGNLLPKLLDARSAVGYERSGGSGPVYSGPRGRGIDRFSVRRWEPNKAQTANERQKLSVDACREDSAKSSWTKAKRSKRAVPPRRRGLQLSVLRGEVGMGTMRSRCLLLEAKQARTPSAAPSRRGDRDRRKQRQERAVAGSIAVRPAGGARSGRSSSTHQSDSYAGLYWEEEEDIGRGGNAGLPYRHHVAGNGPQLGRRPIWTRGSGTTCNASGATGNASSFTSTEETETRTHHPISADYPPGRAAPLRPRRHRRHRTQVIPEPAHGGSKPKLKRKKSRQINAPGSSIVERFSKLSYRLSTPLMPDCILCFMQCTSPSDHWQNAQGFRLPHILSSTLYNFGLALNSRRRSMPVRSTFPPKSWVISARSAEELCNTARSGKLTP
ncbi:hypothetical protein FB451DRAFT_1180542 [Mycena latifolia]|nr:hypothetical protein FB451DRAFT_1180542 [Mycena latifolia]